MYSGKLLIVKEMLLDNSVQIRLILKLNQLSKCVKLTFFLLFKVWIVLKTEITVAEIAVCQPTHIYNIEPF